MNDSKKIQIEEAIKIAQEATSGTEASLREKAFEVVLSHILGSTGNGKSTGKRMSNNPSFSALTKELGAGQGFNTQRIASHLNITVEQVEDLYELKEDILHLGVKPIGAKLSDRQRNLAHALLVGYRLGLDMKEVPVTKLTEIAEEWNIKDGNFGRNINDEYAQMKGGGRGKRPFFSLSPGAVDHLRDEIVGMLG